jgi:hypothetical protein
VAALKVLPHDVATSTIPIDGLGAGLLGASMLGLMYGLIEGSSDGWTHLAILCMIAGAILFGGFCIRQRLEANPLIRPSLLKNKGFTSGLLLGLAFFAAVSGLGYVISLFFQTALGMTPSQAALGLSPLMVGIIIASVAGRHHGTRHHTCWRHRALGNRAFAGHRGERLGHGSFNPDTRRRDGHVLQFDL